MLTLLYETLPGPRWLKVAGLLVLFAGFVVFMFMVGFPWLAENVPLFERSTTVGVGVESFLTA